MPKLSQAKRHRRRLDLAGACAASNSFNQQNNPRKVSEESIATASTEDSSSNSSDVSATPVKGLGSQHTLGEGEESASMPRLKRRKPSSCLTDLVSLSSSSPSTWTQQPTEESCAESTLVTEDPTQTEALTCVSPIWGQFVDMILENDTIVESADQQQRGQDDSSCFSFLEGSPRSSAAATKLATSSTGNATVSSSFPTLHNSSPSHRSSSPLLDPYNNALFYRKNNNNTKKRQQILSPSRMMAAVASRQGQTDISTPPSTSSFVLQDPASLPEALSRLRM